MPIIQQIFTMSDFLIYLRLMSRQLGLGICVKTSDGQISVIDEVISKGSRIPRQFRYSSYQSLYAWRSIARGDAGTES